MATAVFKCNNCNITKSIIFKPGNLKTPLCDICHKEMVRQWNNVGLGSVVDKQMITVDQTMLQAGMVTKDKLIY